MFLLFVLLFIHCGPPLNKKEEKKNKDIRRLKKIYKGISRGNEDSRCALKGTKLFGFGIMWNLEVTPSLPSIGIKMDDHSPSCYSRSFYSGKCFTTLHSQEDTLSSSHNHGNKTVTIEYETTPWSIVRP